MLLHFFSFLMFFIFLFSLLNLAILHKYLGMKWIVLLYEFTWFTYMVILTYMVLENEKFRFRYIAHSLIIFFFNFFLSNLFLLEVQLSLISYSGIQLPLFTIYSFYLLSKFNFTCNNNYIFFPIFLGPTYEFYFRVKFYVSDPSKLSEEYTR